MDNLLQALCNRALGSRLEKQISVSLYPITFNAEIVAEQPTLREDYFQYVKRDLYILSAQPGLFFH